MTALPHPLKPPAPAAGTAPPAAGQPRSGSAQAAPDDLRALPAPPTARAAGSAFGDDFGHHADSGAASGENAPTARHGRNLSALALVYLRHADPARAMVLGLAAMAMGDLRAQTVLLVAESLLRAGDPRQALAVLARFDDPTHGLDAEPRPEQIAARHYLDARIHDRLGDTPRARAALDRALSLAPAQPGPDNAETAPETPGAGTGGDRS